MLQIKRTWGKNTFVYKKIKFCKKDYIFYLD